MSMSRAKISQRGYYIAPRGIQAIQTFDAKLYRDLSRIGITVDDRIVRKMMDAIQPTVTTGSMATPIQFLQEWLPGLVRIITGARKIDDLIGRTTMGSWEDEEIVQQVIENTGFTVPYEDLSNVPLASWNPDYERRTNIRFEEGMRVGVLEEARASRVNIDSASEKRISAALALEIVRNLTGFYGYNSGANRTYGFLNDPGLPNYVTVPVGASSSTLWSTKTFLEIVKDIKAAMSSLRNQSQDNIDPEKVDITLAIATAAVDFLSTPSDFGISVREWLREAYPRVRVTSAPELNAANASANVFYLYAERFQDNSTDGGQVFLQNVPTQFMVLGVQQMAKGYEEDYSNATAGVMVKRPWAVVRRSGI